VIAQKPGQALLPLQLLDVLFEQPIVTVRLVEEGLKCVYRTANKLVGQLVELDLLREMTGYQRNRRFSYQPYLALFEATAPSASSAQGSVSVETHGR
jgi:hypothetical protein